MAVLKGGHDDRWTEGLAESIGREDERTVRMAEWLADRRVDGRLVRGRIAGVLNAVRLRRQIDAQVRLLQMPALG